ncbi:hypothetical protein DFJ73DRAFT_84542 [Zopfochytrium polystomum]|nr:hypothetical protein DFJ73DRAFT_84542 [Zopfochytrium polystomum]
MIFFTFFSLVFYNTSGRGTLFSFFFFTQQKDSLSKIDGLKEKKKKGKKKLNGGGKKDCFQGYFPSPNSHKRKQTNSGNQLFKGPHRGEGAQRIEGEFLGGGEGRRWQE